MTQNTATSPEIKLIVLDIDGTLLNSKLELSERNERALKAAIAEGVGVVLATGKTSGAGTKLIERLGLTLPGIYLQGLMICETDGRVRYQQTLDPNVARQVITFGEDRGFQFYAYSGTRIIVRRLDQYMVDIIQKYHEPLPEVVGALQNILDSVPINKLMAVGDARQIKSLRWQLNAQLGGACRLMQAGIPDMLEILPPGASKGAALRVLLKDLKIPAENVLAMGDAENDTEMLQIAGWGVAIGNASEGLKAVAKAVVATNDEDGVADAIERFVLKRKLDAPADSGAGEKMIDVPAVSATETTSSPEASKPAGNSESAS